MENVCSLSAERGTHLPWHQARIIFSAQLILALLQGRSCSFYRAAELFQSKV